MSTQTIVHGAPRELTDAEAELLENTLPDQSGAPVEMTEAEAVLLEEQGHVLSYEDEGDADVRHGDTVFDWSNSRDGMFRATLTDKQMNMAGQGGVSERVNLYLPNGRPRMVRRVDVAYLVNKRDKSGRAVFFARPPITAEKPSVPCLSTEGKCRKFYDDVQALEHFRNRHRGEYDRREESRRIRMEERNQLLMEHLVHMNAGMAKAQGVDMSKLSALPAAADFIPTEMPDESWSRERIIRFARQVREVPLEIHRAKKQDILKWFFDEPQEGSNG